jgi:hypothetical protein
MGAETQERGVDGLDVVDPTGPDDGIAGCGWGFLSHESGCGSG